jgi:hypothetical protein
MLHGDAISFLMAAIYDRFMDATEQACLQRWRGELLADLETPQTPVI